MKHLIEINKAFVLKTVKELLQKDSPSGFCHEIMRDIESMAEDFGYEYEMVQKGSGIITIPGQKEGRVIGLSAHVDTLGAMVRSITDKGNLKFTLIGGPIVPTFDGEYCKIRTRDGRIYTGTFLSTSPSAHVFKDASLKHRDVENMEVRLDEMVQNKEDVVSLGVCPGDYIFVDPKTIVLDNGFIKSRFIDDKGSVACLMGLLEILSRNKIVPTYTVKILISTYEEVGHGASYIPADVTELLAVDMGCIGDDLSCTEYDVSICAKDSSGPYDYGMVTELINLAKKKELSYAVDIYPYYGSDVGAALRGGQNIKGALIGPGVHASHGMERTHYQALENTIKLLFAYLSH